MLACQVTRSDIKIPESVGISGPCEKIQLPEIISARRRHPLECDCCPKALKKAGVTIKKPFNCAVRTLLTESGRVPPGLWCRTSAATTPSLPTQPQVLLLR